MKKLVKVFSIIAVAILMATMLTGCESKGKKKELTFDGKEGKITFSVNESANYKISTEKADLRTSREQGALVADNFKIGIEFCDDYKYFFDSSLDKLKEKRKDHDDYKEVNYGGVDGVQYFYGGYNCYEVMLPVKNNENYYLALTIYGKEDKEAAAKEAIANSEVLDILNSIKFEAK
ncbi:MAG: hypothetical protein IKD74_07815 [Clostridia bacterium]|nr:hypothetical protein [Clostridia bacterium]